MEAEAKKDEEELIEKQEEDEEKDNFLEKWAQINQYAKAEEKNLFPAGDSTAAGVATKKRSDWLSYSDVPDWVKDVMHEAMADPSDISNPVNYRRRMQVSHGCHQGELMA
jgi:hypothetical protein